MKFLGMQIGRSKPEIDVHAIESHLAKAFNLLNEGGANSLSTADYQLAIDDLGWLAPGKEAGQSYRPKTVQTCRALYESDPMAAQAINVWVNYAIGKGVTFEVENPDAAPELPTPPVVKPVEPPVADEADVEDKPEPGDPEEKPEEQIVLDKFFSYRKNRSMLSSAGQQKLARLLLTDGENYFAFFDTDKVMVIRRIDPLQVTELVKNADDSETILGYKRVVGTKTLYYKDWTNDDSSSSSAKDSQGNAIKWETGVVVYHQTFGGLGDRGQSLLRTSVMWNREFARFMSARVQLLAALNQLVFKYGVKGGQSAVNKVKNSLTSSLRDMGLTAGPEKNPPAIAGSSFVSNDGVTLDTLPRQSGAGDAKSDGDQLKLQHCAGTGVFLHYFGDPSTGNLAIGTAMELPMLKQFESFQELWKDSWRDIFSIVLGEDADADQEDTAVIDIHMPSMLSDDLTKVSTFVTGLVAAFPEAKVPELLRMMLNSLGIQNVDEVMETIAANKVIVDQQKQELQAQQMEILKSRPAASPEQAKVAEVMNELMDLLAMEAA